MFDSDTGDEIRQSEVPFPCDILSCLSCPNVDRAVTVLQNGLVQVWNLGYDTSDKKEVNTSVKVTHCTYKSRSEFYTEKCVKTVLIWVRLVVSKIRRKI